MPTEVLYLDRHFLLILQSLNLMSLYRFVVVFECQDLE